MSSGQPSPLPFCRAVDPKVFALAPQGRCPGKPAHASLDPPAVEDRQLGNSIQIESLGSTSGKMALAALCNRASRGSFHGVGILKRHQFVADPLKGISQRQFPSVRSFRSRAPPLPSGKPALHNPRGFDRKIRQVPIRHVFQDLVDRWLGQGFIWRRQRHACRRRCLVTPGLGCRNSTRCFRWRRRCPEQVPLPFIANEVSRHAPSRHIISLTILECGAGSINLKPRPLDELCNGSQCLGRPIGHALQAGSQRRRSRHSPMSRRFTT